MSTYQNILKFEYEHTKWGPYLTCRWNRLPLFKKWLIDRQVCYVCRFRLSNSTGCNCVTGTSWSRVGGFLSLFHPPGQPAHLKKNPPHLPSPVTGWLALFFWREKTLTCDDFKSYMAHNCSYFLQQHLIYSNLLQLPQRIVNLNFWIFTDLFRVLEINKMQHFDRCNALKIIQRILFFGGNQSIYIFKWTRPCVDVVATGCTLRLQWRADESGHGVDACVSPWHYSRPQKRPWKLDISLKIENMYTIRSVNVIWPSVAVIIHLFGHFGGFPGNWMPPESTRKGITNWGKYHECFYVMHSKGVNNFQEFPESSTTLQNAN